jgi:hypothetical protein
MVIGFILVSSLLIGGAFYAHRSTALQRSLHRIPWTSLRRIELPEIIKHPRFIVKDHNGQWWIEMEMNGDTDAIRLVIEYREHSHRAKADSRLVLTFHRNEPLHVEGDYKLSRFTPRQRMLCRNALTVAIRAYGFGPLNAEAAQLAA